MLLFTVQRVPLGSFRGMGAIYFQIKNRRDILNTILLTRKCI